MDTPVFDKAVSIWNKVVSETPIADLKNSLELYKKLLKFSEIGDYFYWVFNMANYSLDVSENVQSILGYQQSEFTIECLVENIHPEDRPWFLNFENKASEFFAALPIEKLMKYKIRHDFRIKKKDGGYVRLLHQSIIIEHDNNGKVLLTHGLETDITHLKPEGKPVFSIIGLDGEPSYINVNVEKVFEQTRKTNSFADN
jgi:PAS domain-containing protein